MQNYEKMKKDLVEAFQKKTNEKPALKNEELKFSWSNWGFGLESLDNTAQRLENNGLKWIELHGNLYGNDLGYKSKEVLETLDRHDIKVAGVCGMFGPENDLSSNSGISRQNAIDYIRRQIDFCFEVGGTYMLVVPGAVGRTSAYDESEFERSVEALQVVADDFVQAKVRAAIEPIRSAEVSFNHTVADAKKYIESVNHAGVKHINGDVYHMQSEEVNIAQAILDAGDQLINLHLADSNRCALGQGSLDVDAIIMALYLIDYNDGFRFATPVRSIY
ncbi:MAG: sugar phosphate isomerase [Planctomycetota bacterium]|nr:MAG: sugar phosphate isomerase [Planctomycetota bacterium]